MLGLSPKVSLHQLAIKTSAKPVKQTKRKFSRGVASLVAAEITKLREARFIRELQYPKWSANIVHMKTNFVSVDFRDISGAYLKDALPLTLPDLRFDNVVGHRIFSFMDSSANIIRSGI